MVKGLTSLWSLQMMSNSDQMCVWSEASELHSAQLQRRHLKGHDGKSKQNFSLVWLEGVRQHLSWCVYLLLLCLTVCFGAAGVVKLCRCHTLACVIPQIFTVLFSKKKCINNQPLPLLWSNHTTNKSANDNHFIHTIQLGLLFFPFSRSLFLS